MPGADLPCGDIDPLGITGTPAYDPGTGLVFVVAETADARHTLAGIDVATGAVVLRRPVPPPPGAEIAHRETTVAPAEYHRIGQPMNSESSSSS